MKAKQLNRRCTTTMGTPHWRKRVLLLLELRNMVRPASAAGIEAIRCERRKESARLAWLIDVPVVEIKKRLLMPAPRIAMFIRKDWQRSLKEIGDWG